MNRLRTLLALFLLASACTPLVPATPPPQLGQPPGTPVVVDAEYFDAGAFRVNYPDGWRVIKLSEAAAPVMVTFASPDDAMIITISLQPIPFDHCTPDPALYERRAEIDEGMNLYMHGCAPVDQRDGFNDTYDAVLESLTVP